MSNSKVKKYDELEHAQQVLINRGMNEDWEIKVATDRELQLDIDTPELPEQYERVLEIFERDHIIIKKKQTKSFSGNIHIRLFIEEPLAISKRIAWQAALGSDPVREALAMRRVELGIENPILLFERKAK